MFKVLFISVVVLASCAKNQVPSESETTRSAAVTSTSSSSQGSPAAPPLEAGQAEAIFAGGCFWCMEGPFESLDGVISVVSGYTGGHREHPRYEDVGAGHTGHLEAVRVVYEPSRVSYQRLLEVYWRNVDPTQSTGQFCDHGPEYRSAVFVRTEEERRQAEASRADIARRFAPSEIDTRVLDASTFWVAEDYHQDYYRTHPEHYARYRAGCGRDRRLQELWGSAEH